MSRKFLVPLVLPANPTQPLEAAPKQYVDASVPAKTLYMKSGKTLATTDGSGYFVAAYGDSYTFPGNPIVVCNPMDTSLPLIVVQMQMEPTYFACRVMQANGSWLANTQTWLTWIATYGSS